MKRLHADLERDPRTLTMFVRKARITGQLEHPNIVPVHDIGLDDRWAMYFAMKRVEGRTLTTVIESLPPEPPSHDALLDLIDVVVKAADALAFAHSRGVVHLDVKPANVMVGAFGAVYRMDWGVARRFRATGLVEDSADAATHGDADPGASVAVLMGTASPSSRGWAASCGRSPSASASARRPATGACNLVFRSFPNRYRVTGAPAGPCHARPPCNSGRW
jgi:serine/threonine-protein kinase